MPLKKLEPCPRCGGGEVYVSLDTWRCDSEDCGFHINVQDLLRVYWNAFPRPESPEKWVDRVAKQGDPSLDESSIISQDEVDSMIKVSQDPEIKLGIAEERIAELEEANQKLSTTLFYIEAETGKKSTIVDIERAHERALNALRAK